MKRFSFRLETLLQYRKNLEEKERTQLSQLYFEIQKERGKQRTIQLLREKTLNDLREKRTGSIDYEEMNWFQRYLDRLSHEQSRVDIRIQELQKKIDGQKAIVIDATKNRKVLETLKTRKRHEFMLALERQEQKNVDELTVARFRGADQLSQLRTKIRDNR